MFRNAGGAWRRFMRGRYGQDSFGLALVEVLKGAETAEAIEKQIVIR